jgi:hypothetical protein
MTKGFGGIRDYFNYIDGNELNNHSLAPLEEGHEVNTAATAHSSVDLSVLQTLGRTFRPFQQKN